MSDRKTDTTMTDPVDTDALREAVWRHGQRATVVTLDSDMIEDAADEVDRLRADVKASARMHEQARVLADSALKQRDALRAAIENAPHREKCRPEIACTCWKADAL